MKYFVLIAKPEILDLSAFARIFELTRGVTKDEALMVARHCRGFIAENVSKDEADTIVKTCLGKGLETFAVSEDVISSIPKPGIFVKAECRPDGFAYTLEPHASGVFQDVVPWEKISVAAAAPIKEQKITMKITKEGPSPAARAASLGILATTGIPIKFGETKKVKKETIEYEIVFYLELFFNITPYRIRMKSDKFDFSYLGARKGYSTLINFNLMLADINILAPKAVKNQGFKGILKKEILSAMGYDSPHYFDKECRWLIALANNGVRP